MASMKDVAKLAGVSVSTVSRVINNTVPVDENTRKKVQSAIKKTNYRPNLLARGLRSKSGHLIGLVVPEIMQSAFASFIEYTEMSVTRRGLDLIVGNTRNDPDIEERFIDSLMRRNIDGIIFSRVSDKSHILHILDRGEIPVVIMDRVVGDEKNPTVVLDNYLAGRLAAEHLIGLGHKKFACIAGKIEVGLFRDRLKGFQETLLEHGIILEDKAIYRGETEYQTGKDAVDYFLSKQIEMTALWAECDLVAIGAMEQLKRNHINIPNGISVVGVDDLDISAIVYPSLTTIAQPFAEMCDVAVQMVLDQKNGIEIEERKVVLEPKLVVRESTKAV